MERTTTKNNPMLDEQREQETASLRRGAPVESRSQEGREQEGPGEDQPMPETQPGGEPIEWSGQDIDRGDVRRREAIAQAIADTDFPAVRDQILETARGAQAPDWVMDTLRDLPAGRTYENVQDVWTTLGGPEERRF